MSGLEPPSKASEDIESTDVHHVLSNERRRIVIEQLRQSGGTMDARKLSEYIAIQETGQDPPPTNIRQSAYVALQQTHLPKLDDVGVIDYDPNTKTVELTDSAKHVTVYMETVPKYGISWSEYYLGNSLVGMLLVASANVGVPFLSSVSSETYAFGVFALITASAIYQTYQQGSSFISRLRQ